MADSEAQWPIVYQAGQLKQLGLVANKYGEPPMISAQHVAPPNGAGNPAASKAPKWNFAIYNILSRTPAGIMSIDCLYKTGVEWCPLLRATSTTRPSQSCAAALTKGRGGDQWFERAAVRNCWQIKTVAGDNTTPSIVANQLGDPASAIQPPPPADITSPAPTLALPAASRPRLILRLSPASSDAVSPPPAATAAPDASRPRLILHLRGANTNAVSSAPAPAAASPDAPRPRLILRLTVNEETLLSSAAPVAAPAAAPALPSPAEVSTPTRPAEESATASPSPPAKKAKNASGSRAKKAKKASGSSAPRESWTDRVKRNKIRLAKVLSAAPWENYQEFQDEARANPRVFDDLVVHEGEPSERHHGDGEPTLANYDMSLYKKSKSKYHWTDFKKPRNSAFASLYSTINLEQGPTHQSVEAERKWIPLKDELGREDLGPKFDN